MAMSRTSLHQRGEEVDFRERGMAHSLYLSRKKGGKKKK